MPTLLAGTPTHVLIVHAVVVLLPAAVLGALLLVVVPASRRAFSLLTLLVALVACLCVPLAFLSGAKLRQRLPGSPAINHHVALAHELLPVAAVFGLVLASFYALDLARRAARGDLNRVEDRLVPAHRRRSLFTPRWEVATFATGVLLVVAATLTVITVVRVGDSGAHAAWQHRLVSAPAR